MLSHDTAASPTQSSWHHSQPILLSRRTWHSSCPGSPATHAPGPRGLQLDSESLCTCWRSAARLRPRHRRHATDLDALPEGLRDHGLLLCDLARGLLRRVDDAGHPCLSSGRTAHARRSACTLRGSRAAAPGSRGRGLQRGPRDQELRKCSMVLHRSNPWNPGEPQRLKRQICEPRSQGH